MWLQRRINLGSYKRGFHLITDTIEQQIPELRIVDVGIVHIFIQHSSASLSINENADPTVRSDLETHINQMVPENAHYYTHTYEGSDDMPAHIKSSLIGASVSIPVTEGQLNLGTWQGIYLGEHRDFGGDRHVVVTVHGE